MVKHSKSQLNMQKNINKNYEKKSLAIIIKETVICQHTAILLYIQCSIMFILCMHTEVPYENQATQVRVAVSEEWVGVGL